MSQWLRYLHPRARDGATGWPPTPEHQQPAVVSAAPGWRWRSTPSVHSSTTWTADSSTARSRRPSARVSRALNLPLSTDALVRSHGSDAGALARREGFRSAPCLVAEQGVADGGAGEDSNLAGPGPGHGFDLRF